MRPRGCEADLLRTLAAMPFLDRQEMVAVSGWSRGAVYESMGRLEGGGLAAWVPHGTDLVPPTRRFHLTADGLDRLAGEAGISPDELVHRYPPSPGIWRRILIERLDALAAIYRLTAGIAEVAYPLRFHWYPRQTSGRRRRPSRRAHRRHRPPRSHRRQDRLLPPDAETARRPAPRRRPSC